MAEQQLETYEVAGSLPVRDAVSGQSIEPGGLVRLDPSVTLIPALLESGSIVHRDDDQDAVDGEQDVDARPRPDTEDGAGAQPLPAGTEDPDQVRARLAAAHPPVEEPAAGQPRTRRQAKTGDAAPVDAPVRKDA